MKKTVLSLLAIAFTASVTFAQTVEEGIKFLYYERNKSAVETLQKVVVAKPKDAYSIYWLGQAYLNYDKLSDAKALYQKALQDGVNDPLIWVGSAHVDIVSGGDINAAKQKFEQAITATKGKKGIENADILNAVGRANAASGSKIGDALYAIDKLKRAAEIDTKNPDIDINLAINYLKLGSEHGGEAVEALRDAIARNPQYARAYTRIGRIYRSQDNKESMNEWYGKAIAADPAYGPVYLDYFNYFQNRDVNEAKNYLDKYVANADQDCQTDYFAADYLFRAGKYQESLNKANAMANNCKDFPRLNILYAFNYDRLGKLAEAKSSLEGFFTSIAPEKITSDDYIFAGTLLAKIPGSEDAAIAYLTKAVDLDTIRDNKIGYLKTSAKILDSLKRYDQELLVQFKITSLKKKTEEFDYYRMGTTAIKAKNYTAADSIGSIYIATYPDKPQGYTFRVTAAKALDADTSKGLAIEPINQYNDYLARDTKDTVASKKLIFRNFYYLLFFYNDHAKDLNKSVEVLDKMLALYPDAGEEHDFADKTKQALQAALKKKGSGK